MNVLGHLMLFTPIITLLNWIPLVGALLGGIFFAAAFIFSLIWGTMIHLIVLMVAWIAWRPCYGLCLLVCIALIVGIMFMPREWADKDLDEIMAMIGINKDSGKA